MKNSLYLFFSILLIFSACSSSKDTTKEEGDKFPSEETAISPINKLEVNIPLGWKLISDNNDQLFDIWLLNVDKNSSITFIPLSLSKNFELNSSEENLNLLFELIKNQKKISNNNLVLLEENELYKAGNALCLSFQYSIDDNLFNSIIFYLDNKYYECLAYFDSNYEPSYSEFESLIETQNFIILNSIIK